MEEMLLAFLIIIKNKDFFRQALKRSNTLLCEERKIMINS